MPALTLELLSLILAIVWSMCKELERGSQGAITGAATTKSEVLILSGDDWYLALSMADGVKATVDEEGMSMDEEGSRVDGGQKELCWMGWHRWVLKK